MPSENDRGDIVLVSCNKNKFATYVAEVAHSLNFGISRATSSLAMVKSPPSAVFLFHDSCCVDVLQFVQWCELVGTLNEQSSVAFVVFVKAGDKATASLLRASGAEIVMQAPAIVPEVKDRRSVYAKKLRSLLKSL